MSSTTQPTLDEWIWPADDEEPEDDWLECGHPAAHADDNGECVLCNVAGAVTTDADTKTALTRDQAAVSPFDGGAR